MLFASEIEPRLFLGDADDSANISAIRKHGITLIINCTNDLCNHFKNGAQIRYFKGPVDDNLKKREVEKMLKCLPAAVAEIADEIRRGGAVLVHCAMGKQRSATVVAAYLMAQHSLGVDEAIDFVRSKRGMAFTPEPNFVDALSGWLSHSCATAREMSS